MGSGAAASLAAAEVGRGRGWTGVAGSPGETLQQQWIAAGSQQALPESSTVVQKCLDRSRLGLRHHPGWQDQREEQEERSQTLHGSGMYGT